MKQLVFTLVMAAGISVLGQSQKTYPLNTQQSTIEWKGSYAFLFSSHSGTVRFKNGTLRTHDGNITGGQFTVDMTTISNEEYEKGVGPVAHLRNSDFFYVEQYPEASLVFTSVEYFKNENIHKILAALTIKGITQTITFWATVQEATKTMETRFIIDRTLWGITYNNKLKNDAISDAIELIVKLQF